MNNNEIKNEKVEVPTGISLNDKDYLNSLLSTLKEITKNYTISLTEASNEVLYNEYTVKNALIKPSKQHIINKKYIDFADKLL